MTDVPRDKNGRLLASRALILRRSPSPSRRETEPFCGLLLAHPDTRNRATTTTDGRR